MTATSSSSRWTVSTQRTCLVQQRRRDTGLPFHGDRPRRQDAAGRHRRRAESRHRRQRLVPKSRRRHVLRHGRDVGHRRAAAPARTAAPTRHPPPSSAACWDRAGNVSAPSEFGLRYDSTPPAVTNLDADGEDESVRLRWAVSGATQVEVWRSPGRDGSGPQRGQPRHDGTRARPPRPQRTPLRLQPGRARRRRQHHHAHLLGDPRAAAARRQPTAPPSTGRPRSAGPTSSDAGYYNVQTPPQRPQAAQRVARQGALQARAGRGASTATGSGSSPVAATPGSSGPAAASGRATTTGR